MYFKTLEKQSCSGCTACFSVCPKHCITMQTDVEGFFYPVIDKTVCIGCGLCEKVCSFDNPIYDNIDIQDVYAAYLLDEQQRMQSTSGGVFYAIARWIIEQGGIVYGAAFDENFKLLHIGVDELDSLNKLRGSKYLQSYLGDVFSEMEKHLKNDRWIYFVGTGCQVAGLKAFLRKDYATLVTSDLVCHGVPSQLMFDWHLDYLREKENAEITFYSFRDNKGWGGCESYSYVSESKIEKIKSSYSYHLSPYLYSFMYSFNHRYSCYSCKFAKVPRQGDITLADFWGVKNVFPEIDTTKGVSLVLVNSKNGNKVWNQIKNKLKYHHSCIENAAVENGNLLHATRMPEIRKHCYKLISQRGYKSVANKEFKAPLKMRLKVYLPFYLRYFLGNKLFYMLKQIVKILKSICLQK